MTSVRAEHLSPQRTCCRRPARYDQNQASAEVLTPKVTCSLSNRIPWSTVSKAAESMAVSQRSTASRRSERTRIIAVSVEYPHRKPDWVDGSRQLASRYVTSCNLQLCWPHKLITDWLTAAYCDEELLILSQLSETNVSWPSRAYTQVHWQININFTAR